MTASWDHGPLACARRDALSMTDGNSTLAMLPGFIRFKSEALLLKRSLCPTMESECGCRAIVMPDLCTAKFCICQTTHEHHIWAGSTATVSNLRNVPGGGDLMRV